MSKQNHIVYNQETTRFIESLEHDHECTNANTTMSKESLFLYRPDQPGKPLKLAFTTDDLPLLKAWYEMAFKGLNTPAFDELGIHMIDMFAKSISFSLFRMHYRWKQFKAAIKSAFIKNICEIKNFLRWIIISLKKI